MKVLMALMAIQMNLSYQVKIEVDAPVENPIKKMATYVPDAGCPNCPKDFRVLDCWECFQAQGKVCMDKSHNTLMHHLQTSKTSAIFCCKQDNNKEYCKDGWTYGNKGDADYVEMICSPSSFGASSGF